MREIYRSDNLRVRATPGQDISRWFITFDHVGDNPSLERAGFGEAFLHGRGISLISVVGRGNHWYQYPDMSGALDVIRRELQTASVRITYGVSMGGYAAVRFAEAVNATACLAISPQYSNDPRKVPFERRWMREARAIHWLPDLDGPIHCRIRPILIYDSREDDARHAFLIAQDTRVSAIAIPYGGHPTSTYLSSAGLLTGLIDDLHTSRLDTGRLQQRVLEARKSTPIWIGELARRQPGWRPRTGVHLGRQAVALHPNHDLLMFILAQRLEVDRCFEEALDLYRRAYHSSSYLPIYGLCYARALAAAGSTSEALALATALRGSHPHDTAILEFLAELHGQLGSLEREIQRLAARSAEPSSHPLDRDSLSYYRSRLRAMREARSPRLIRYVRAWLRHRRSKARTSIGLTNDRIERRI
jgi:hypothetical protein